MDDQINAPILRELKDKIQRHNLKSGEVILEFGTKTSHPNEKSIIYDFFTNHNIKTAYKDFAVTQISEFEAKSAVFYGLSTKMNYTVLDNEFTEKDKNFIWYTFTFLFHKPTFYQCNCHIYNTELDLGDFWLTGGAIIIDKDHIGILWINDLYDKF